MKGRPFFEEESFCEMNFNKNSSYWHIYTSGIHSPIIFASDEDFEFGMNLMAWCADKFPEIQIYTFALMNTHLHIVLSGQENDVLRFFSTYSNRLIRNLSSAHRYINPCWLEPQLAPISDLKALRNEIIYVNRNGYVSNSNYTPYSYPWGAAPYFFNPILEKLPSRKVNQLPVKLRRNIFKSKEIDTTIELEIFENVILPSSYCKIAIAESFYRNCRQYFSSLTRNHEAFSEVAKRLGDKVFIPDEELYSAIVSICFKKFQSNQPNLLPPNEKNGTGQNNALRLFCIEQAD